MTKSKFAFSAVAVAMAGLVIWLVMQTDGVPDPGQPGDPSTTGALASGQVLTPKPEGSTSSKPDASPQTTRIAAVSTAAMTVNGEVLSKGVPYPQFAFTLQWFDGLDTTGEPEAEHEVRSDGDGRFIWRGEARQQIGTVRAIASSTKAKIWSTAVIVQADTTEVTLELSVSPFDRELFGRVHDAAGASIAGAQLSINGWTETKVITGSDGRYELRVPAPGYPLVVSAGSYQHLLLNGYMPDESQRHEYDIEMQPSLGFRGRVVDEDSAPVAGAKVRASGLFGGGVLTDAEGQFELGGAKPGSNHELSATHKGFRVGKEYAEPGGAPIEIVLLPGLSLTLKVTGPNGEAIVGASVHIVPNPYSGWRPRGMTGEDGRRRLEDLEAGPFDVIVQKAGFIRYRQTVDASKLAGDVMISLRPGFAVSGQVVDMAGVPVPGASICCELPEAAFSKRMVGTRATSDANGRFEVTDLPPEACTIYAHHKGYSRASIEGVLGARTGLVLRMKPAPMVAGRAVDGTTGEPIAKFKVQIASDYKVQPLHMDPLMFQDCDGYWQARHWQMKAGAELFVEVAAEGYAPTRIRSVSRVGPPRDQNVIRLLPGTTVTGVLRDKVTGAPIASARVLLKQGDAKDDLHRFFQRMVPFSHRTGQISKTDAEGRFSIESVPAGSNRLALGHPDYPEATFGPFEVATGPGRLEVQPTMSAGVTLRGRVTGLPNAAGRSVRALGFQLKEVATVVQPDLTFSLSGLGPGNYYLILDGNRSHGMRVAVAATDVKGVELALRAGTGSIRASVRGLDSGRAQVATIGGPPGSRKTRDWLKFDNGGFVLEGLAPGRYIVEVYGQIGAGEGEAEVQVGTGEAPIVVEYRAKK
ncbi:MAG: carboxypeptidase regulatory-like domain-containing protein [bacterium]|nr:carboxypeptidase regulatory-like domain-containing protein [bacterium]